jgi:tetratricopeptide (TPR) repeat protein
MIAYKSLNPVCTSWILIFLRFVKLSKKYAVRFISFGFLIAYSNFAYSFCPCTSFDSSHVALNGTVVSIEKDGRAMIANVKVEKIYKGVISGDIIPIEFEPDGTDCAASFEVQEKALFLTRYDSFYNKRRLRASICKAAGYHLIDIQPQIDAYYYKVRAIRNETNLNGETQQLLDKLLHIQLAAKDYLQVINTTENLLKYDPTNTKYLFSDAVAKAQLAYYNENYNDEALKIYNTLIKRNPQNIQAIKAKFQLLANLKRLGEFKGILKDYSELSLFDVDFSNKNLRGYNFRGAKIYNVNFNNTNLEIADFSESRITNTNFTKSQLKNSKFKFADILNANFSNAVLTNSDFSHANLVHTKMLNADFRGSKVDYLNIISNPNVEGSWYSPYALKTGDNLKRH